MPNLIRFWREFSLKTSKLPIFYLRLPFELETRFSIKFIYYNDFLRAVFHNCAHNIQNIILISSFDFSLEVHLFHGVMLYLIAGQVQ